MAYSDIGNLQDGLAADSSTNYVTGHVSVPPGGLLTPGLPLVRNVTSLSGNWAGRWASLPGLSALASGDTYVQIDGPNGGNGSGVWRGPAFLNPWLNTDGTSNTKTVQKLGTIQSSGVCPTLVGAIQGGSTVTIGGLVGKPAALGNGTANAQGPYLTTQAATNGLYYGVVIASPLQTSLSQAVAATGSQASGCWDETGFLTTQPLIINPGGANQETVTPTAVTLGQGATVTVTFTTTATGGVTTFRVTVAAGYQGVYSATNLFQVTISNGTNTVTQAAKALADAINASGYGFGGPSNIVGSGGIFNLATPGAQTGGSPANGPIFYATSAAGVVTLSAAYPGTWANGVTVTCTTTDGAQTVATGNSGVMASGTDNAFTAPFLNTHVANEPVIAICQTLAQVLVTVPTVTLAQVASIRSVDLFVSR
jgi:hypothetical protein